MGSNVVPLEVNNMTVKPGRYKREQRYINRLKYQAEMKMGLFMCTLTCGKRSGSDVALGTELSARSPAFGWESRRLP